MKIKYYAAMLFAFSCLAFASCDDGELDSWELLEFGVKSSVKENTVFSHQATSMTVGITTNSTWSIELPAWMHADKTEGAGDAEVTISIDENKSIGTRTGYIKMNAGNKELQGNVVGSKTSTIKISQRSIDDAINIEFTNIDVTRELSHIDSDGIKRYFYSGVLSYNISSELLSAAEISSMMSDISIKVRLGFYEFNDPYALIFDIWEPVQVSDATQSTLELEKIYSGHYPWDYTHAECKIFYSIKIGEEKVYKYYTREIRINKLETIS